MGVLFVFLTENKIIESEIDKIGEDVNFGQYAIISILFSAIIIYGIYQLEKQKKSAQ